MMILDWDVLCIFQELFLSVHGDVNMILFKNIAKYFWIWKLYTKDKNSFNNVMDGKTLYISLLKAIY